MIKKEALLKLLVKKYKNKTKEQLLAHILCGEIRVNGEKCLDPKALLNQGSVLQIEESRTFVSRGGKKLDALFNEWQINIKGKIFIDAGCSTGGFTDCLLKRGASLIYAVDVGYNQLDYSLRINPKVHIMEKINITHLSQEMFSVRPDAAVMDLSFRSVRGAAAHLLNLVNEKWIIALIKPQFEWQTPAEDFEGIIKDKTHYSSILSALVEDLAAENVFVNKVAVSSLKGRKGNSEFFFFLEKHSRKKQGVIHKQISRLVKDM